MKSGLCKYYQPLRLEKPSNFRLSGQKPRLARVHKPLPEVTLKDLEEAFLGDQDDLT